MDPGLLGRRQREGLSGARTLSDKELTLRGHQMAGMAMCVEWTVQDDKLPGSSGRGGTARAGQQDSTEDEIENQAPTIAPPDTSWQNDGKQEWFCLYNNR